MLAGQGADRLANGPADLATGPIRVAPRATAPAIIAAAAKRTFFEVTRKSLSLSYFFVTRRGAATGRLMPKVQLQIQTKPSEPMVSSITGMKKGGSKGWDL